MKILVTGATGFIGSSLASRLKDRGHEVVCFTKSKRNLSNLKKKGFLIRHGDITDFRSVKSALKDIDVIYSLAAALPHHKLSDKEYFSINSYGVGNILEATLKSSVKQLIHVSTVGIYGPTNSKVINEKSPRHLTDGYSKSKALAEDLIRDFQKIHQLPITIIRPTIAYGPADIRPGFIDLFRLINKGLFIPIGDGNNYFHTIFVDNLVDALVLVLNNKKAFGQDFIIGDEPCPRMKDVYLKVASIEGKKIWPVSIPLKLAILLGKIFEISNSFGIKGPFNTRRVKFITENRRYSTGKAHSLLKFSPKISLDQGLLQTYNWYKKHQKI